MIFGKKSDLKNHLSVKKPTWTHKVMAHSPHEQSSEMAQRGIAFREGSSTEG
jgi:hypothetical protein